MSAHNVLIAFKGNKVLNTPCLGLNLSRRAVRWPCLYVTRVEVGQSIRSSGGEGLGAAARHSAQQYIK